MNAPFVSGWAGAADDGDLATWTPPRVDTALADLSARESAALRRRDSAINAAHSAIFQSQDRA